MIKKTTTCVISAPVDTYSGYGNRSVDFIKALIEAKPDWDIKILSQRWGNTRTGYLEDHNDEILRPLIIPQLTAKPDVWMQVTVPNEFQKVGKYNIGVTASIETTLAPAPFIEGCNKMDLVITSSEHGRKVLAESKYDVQDKRTKQVTSKIELQTPIEILFEGVDLNTYFPTKENTLDLSEIKESFCYIFMGHWMQGSIGHDRKNVGYLVKSFLETFKNTSNPPALLLKTQIVGSSIMDKEKILARIDEIRKTVKGKLPNIYVLHGELSDKEVNELYNHEKVKAMISLTKGEGFGRPLLEFTTSNKPVIASGWSGQLDFLSKEFTVLIGGELEKLDRSAVVKDMLIPEASWFKPSDKEVAHSYKEIKKNYKKYLANAKRQGHLTRTKFSYDEMVKSLSGILERNVTKAPEKLNLNLPKLTLPKLKKI